MYHFGIDHFIVGSFLLITLLIGLLAGRGIKDIREYAIANKMYGTGVLTITFLATYLGGFMTLSVQETILSYGLVAGLAPLGTTIMFLYAGAFIAPKMLRFQHSITLGDMMQELYGLHGGIITGIIGGVYTIALVGIQVVALGYICEHILGWRADWSIGLGGAILILYASLGGVKSVTISDAFQFMVFVIVIPLIANVAISQVGGIQELFSQLPADKLTVYQHEQFPRYFSIFLVWCLFPAFLSAPPAVQRILMARHAPQATNMLFISAALILVVRVLVILSCLAVFLLAPDIKPSEGGAFAYVINAYFSPGLKGLSVAGLLAIVMSTFDSFLNAGSLLVTHNVLKPYFDHRKVAFNELKVVRYITFLMGCTSILVALTVNEVRTLSYFGVTSFAPVITIPLIAGVLGLKTDTRSFLISSAVTIITFIFFNLFLPEAKNYLIFPMSLIANAISFFTAHIIKNQGIVIVQSQGEESGPRPQNALYIVFALFMCFNYMIPYFMYTRQGEGTMFAIRFIGAVLCVGLLLKPYWGDWLQKYFHYYWRFTLLYCLPFSTTTLYLLNDGGTEWTVNVALASMLLVILIDCRNFVMLSLAGVVLGVLCSHGIKGHMLLSYEHLYTLVYTFLFSTFIGLIFARSKGQRAERQQKMFAGEDTANQASLLQIAEARNEALKTLQNTGIHNLLQVAKELQELSLKNGGVSELHAGDVSKLHAIEATLISMAFQLQGIDTTDQEHLRLQVASVSIQQLLTKVRKKLRGNGRKQSIRYQQATQHKELVCDPEHLITLISKSIAALQKQPEGLQGKEKQSFLLSLEDTTLHYPLPDVGECYVKKVKALRIAVTAEDNLPALAPNYQPDLTTSPVTESAMTTQSLEQLANERIVKGHYGHAEVTPSMFCYVIPIDLQEVRPKDMDKAYMELGVAPVRANDLYKSDTVDAQAQEKEFLAAVEQHSSADMGLVKTALELIKWYHGPVSRHSGEPFYLHPLSVAQIVLDYNTDEPTILGALLHDTVGATPMLLQHIRTVFGEETAAIVDTVTHLQRIDNAPYKIKLSAEEHLQMLESIGNVRALYVKLAEGLHNMRTIAGRRTLAEQQQIASETMQCYVPLAERLGLHNAAQELKERCTQVLSSALH